MLGYQPCRCLKHNLIADVVMKPRQARNQDFMWGEGGGGANEAKVDQTTEMYFLLSDPYI